MAQKTTTQNPGPKRSKVATLGCASQAPDVVAKTQQDDWVRRALEQKTTRAPLKSAMKKKRSKTPRATRKVRFAASPEIRPIPPRGQKETKKRAQTKSSTKRVQTGPRPGNQKAPKAKTGKQGRPGNGKKSSGAGKNQTSRRRKAQRKLPVQKGQNTLKRGAKNAKGAKVRRGGALDHLDHKHCNGEDFREPLSDEELIDMLEEALGPLRLGSFWIQFCLVG